jgi:hypothetical protein
MSLPKPPKPSKIAIEELKAVLQTENFKAIEIPTPPIIPIAENSILAKEVSNPYFDEDQTISKVMFENLKPRHARDPKVLAFIVKYLECRCHKQAAKAVGMTGWDGRSLIRQADIKETIDKITASNMERFDYTADEAVARVKEIAFVDPIEVQNEDGSFKSKMSEMSPEIRRAIKKMRVRNTYEEDPNGMTKINGQIIEIEFWDKIRSLELLGPEKEVFKKTTKVEHEIGKNMRDALLESAKKVEMIDVTPKRGDQ